MNPPSIFHLHGFASDNRLELCSDCSKALHMGKGEAALLKYYASCSDGFSPAVATICSKTGISRRRVFYDRDKLCDHGVTAIENNKLFIDWNRIRVFASLDPGMTNKHCYIAPVNTKKRHYNIYINNKLFIRLESCSVEQAVKILGALSNEQYEKLKVYIGNKRRLENAA